MLWAKPKPALTVAKAVLSPSFPGMHVASGQPVINTGNPRPDKYIVLGILGSDYPNPAFTEPRIMVNCYAKTSALAGDLADEALAVLLNARGQFAGTWVRFGNPQGPYPLNDPDISDRYRFQVHGELRLHN